MDNKLAKGYTYAALATIGWGTMFISCKPVYASGIGPFLLLFFRYLIASIVCLVYYRNYSRPQFSKVERKQILVIGAVGYFFHAALCLVGNTYITASMGSIINTITPIGIMFFAVLILKEKNSLQKVLGILVATVGSVIIVGFAGGDNAPIGIVLNFASMIVWSITTVLIRKYSSNIDAVWLTIGASIVAMIIDLPFAAWEIVAKGLSLSSITLSAVVGVLAVGIISTAGSNIWWSKALERMTAATCSMFYALMPITTGVLEVFLLKGTLTMNFIIGSVIIIIGMAIVVLSEKRTNLE